MFFGISERGTVAPFRMVQEKPEINGSLDALTMYVAALGHHIAWQIFGHRTPSDIDGSTPTKPESPVVSLNICIEIIVVSLAAAATFRRRLAD